MSVILKFNVKNQEIKITWNVQINEDQNLMLQQEDETREQVESLRHIIRLKV